MIDSCVLVLIGWDREPDHVYTHGNGDGAQNILASLLGGSNLWISQQ